MTFETTRNEAHQIKLMQVRKLQAEMKDIIEIREKIYSLSEELKMSHIAFNDKDYLIENLDHTLKQLHSKILRLILGITKV